MEDITGKKYGKLTVIEQSGKDKHNNILWKCQCECGNVTSVSGYRLRNGVVKSCGCFRKEFPAKRFRRHGLRHHPLYVIWVDMRRRCETEKDCRYKDYGGRGISVCEEWHDFQTFYNWAIKAGYKEELSIDRIDNDENYTPQNCRWATREEQANNKRNNRPICIDGETKNLFQWCRQYNINPSTVITRINRGWSEKDAITKSTRKRGKT